MIFGYISKDKAIEIYDNLKESLDIANVYLEICINKVIDIEDNFEKNKKMEDLTISIYESINDIKKMIENFNQTNNSQFIEDSVKEYINILLPKINELRNMKYIRCDVLHNNKDDTFHLIQEKNSIEQYEITDYEKTGVIKFVFKKASKKTNTRKIVNKPNKNKKTRKIIPTISIVEDEDEDEEEEKDEQEINLEDYDQENENE